MVSKFYSISLIRWRKIGSAVSGFSFVVQKENGQFHNEVSSRPAFLDVVGSERLSMSNLLGFISYFEYRYSCRLQISYKGDAGKFLPTLFSYSSPRPVAFFNFWVKRAFPAKRNHFPQFRYTFCCSYLTGRLVEQYERNASLNGPGLKIL